jgi:membrane protease YdiL (CAAX protease family)
VKSEGWVLAVAMTFPTAAAAGYFIGLGSEAVTEPDANPCFQAAYAVSKVVQFLLPIVWLAAADRAALTFRRLSFRGVPTGLVFGVATAALIFALYFGWLADSPTFDGVADRARAKVGEFGLASPARYVVLAAFITILHSLLEEYYWRWFVYGRLRHCHVPRATALVLAGLAFMGHHVVILGVFFPGRFWPVVMPFSLGVGVGGIVWAWLYERSGSILGPWLSHLIVDAAMMAVGYHLVFGRH